jgi:hypothetical protein
VNWQTIATLIAALSFVGTGFALSWKFGLAFGELQSRDGELKTGLGELKITSAALTAALADLPVIKSQVAILQSATARNTSDIRELREAQAHVRGRLASQHDPIEVTP